jgi:hypothetical protein
MPRQKLNRDRTHTTIDAKTLKKARMLVGVLRGKPGKRGARFNSLTDYITWAVEKQADQDMPMMVREVAPEPRAADPAHAG